MSTERLKDEVNNNNGVVNHYKDPIITSSTHASKKKAPRNKFSFICAIMASMTSALLGYDIGVMSGAVIFIKEEMRITDVQVELLVGTLNIYALVGSALAGRTADWIGRRFTIVVAAANFFVGAIVMGLATNYTLLMVGRFIAGIGVGYACMIAPVYTTELAPTHSRGFLASFPEVFVNVGVLLGYISNYGFSKLPPNLGWRFMLGVGAIPALLLAVNALLMPESPRWLVMEGRLADAKRVLNKISNSTQEAQDRLNDIKEAAGISRDNHNDVVQVPKQAHGGEGVWKDLIIRPTRPVRHILLCALGIHFFQQAVGFDTVVLYSPRIFEKAGITSTNKKLLATIAVGVIKTMFIVVAMFLLDRIGRRPLLLTSYAGMVISLVTLGGSLTVINRDPTRSIPWAVGLAVVTVLSAVAFFSIGAGPIAMVYSAEVFPLRLRAQGISLGMAVNRVVSGAISMSFLSLYKAITIGGAFFLFAGIAAVGLVFFFLFYPETQGKTLEEIEGLFGNFVSWRSSTYSSQRRQESEG
ncbi:Putative polyol transporter 1 [Linum perenne]